MCAMVERSEREDRLPRHRDSPAAPDVIANNNNNNVLLELVVRGYPCLRKGRGGVLEDVYKRVEEGEMEVDETL